MAIQVVCVNVPQPNSARKGLCPKGIKRESTASFPYTNHSSPPTGNSRTLDFSILNLSELRQYRRLIAHQGVKDPPIQAHLRLKPGHSQLHRASSPLLFSEMPASFQIPGPRHSPPRSNAPKHRLLVYCVFISFHVFPCFLSGIGGSTHFYMAHSESPWRIRCPTQLPGICVGLLHHGRPRQVHRWSFTILLLPLQLLPFSPWPRYLRRSPANPCPEL